MNKAGDMKNAPEAFPIGTYGTISGLVRTYLCELGQLEQSQDYAFTPVADSYVFQAIGLQLRGTFSVQQSRAPTASLSALTSKIMKVYSDKLDAPDVSRLRWILSHGCYINTMDGLFYRLVETLARLRCYNSVIADEKAFAVCTDLETLLTQWIDATAALASDEAFVRNCHWTDSNVLDEYDAHAYAMILAGKALHLPIGYGGVSTETERATTEFLRIVCKGSSPRA